MASFIKNIFSSRTRMVVIFVILVVVGILMWNFSKSKVGVKTAKIEKGQVQENLILSGEINAEEFAQLAFQSSGELSYLGVKEGEMVKKGTVLARLDTTVAYQSYLTAQADLRNAQAALNNVYDQLKGNENDESYSQIQERTIAEVAKDKAYRAYVAAQKNLNNSSLKAPFDGLISSITNSFTGINTSFQQPQIVMFNPNTIYFETSADQTEVTKLIIGQKVKITLDSFTDEVVEGEVYFIANSPKLGEAGSVYKVKVKINDNSDFSKYKVGMTGDASFIISEKQDVMYVPSAFIKADANGRYVFHGKKNNKEYVEVGLEGEERVEIKSDKVLVGDIIYD